MDRIDYSQLPLLPLPWDYDQLYVVSPLQWQQEQIPASALKFNQHFKKIDITSQDVDVFKGLIRMNFADNFDWLKESLSALQCDVLRSKSCLYVHHEGT